ncbi:hypothetical protein [Hyphomicrobium sp.]|uniref:porin n=1 Tax=Hyphomicrobium sp. TaxID=82 RepID=UPI002D77277E|nr:hypothetical protein [Hyphomicrobium sp.]HET6387790.1 hypothetical protein [Hyphomicrobium sp.]
MFGGTYKRAGFAAGIAAAGLALVGTAPASAADLGGNCCADLEERIAELEATAARKGNRKVSLTVSGFVNEAVLGWDDGVERNAYVVTNETAQDRVRFLGQAQIAPGWNAGYLLELGVRGAREDRISQDGPGADNGVSVRHSAWYLSGKEYGKVWVGQTSDAADGITEINLANTNHFSYSNSWGNTFGDGGSGFFVRRTDGVLSAARYGQFVARGTQQAIPGEGHRFNVVKYEAPTIAGFTASAAWGEDDIWNIALRYAGEFSGFKLAGGIAYTESNDIPGPDHTSGVSRGVGDTQEFGLSASIFHVETGLYASGAYGHLHDDGLDALYGRNVDDDTSFWTIQAGIERKFFPIGKTTVFGEYFNLDRGAASTNSGGILNVPTLGTGFNQVANSQIEGWGVGLNQNLSEVVDLYLSYKHVQLDVTTTNGVATRDASIDAIQFITAGAQIKF